MRQVRTPTADEREELERMKQQEIGRVAIRAHIIILSAEGYIAQDIAAIHQISDVTVYKWLDRFDAEGPEGLYDRPREGRPPKVDDEAEALIEDTLEDPPSEQGYETFTRWTMPLLATHLKEKLGLEVHPETVRTTVIDLGFCWGRPRWMAPKPEAQASNRMQAISHTIMTAPDETVILLEDETIFKRLPPLRGMWMRCGHQTRIPTPPQNDDFCLYGALDLYTGEWSHARFETANSDASVAFLEQLARHYPDQPVLLIWDQASFHTSQQVQTWLEKHHRFSVELLPPRSPQLNPVEDIWGHLKDRVAANLVRSLDAIFEACNAFFRELSPHDLLRSAGLLPT